MKYLSLYGYVYMVKHKHDILEMFKDTQIKVRSKLGNIINAFRLDRRGRKMNQEFWTS